MLLRLLQANSYAVRLKNAFGRVCVQQTGNFSFMIFYRKMQKNEKF